MELQDEKTGIAMIASVIKNPLQFLTFCVFFQQIACYPWLLSYFYITWILFLYKYQD